MCIAQLHIFGTYSDRALYGKHTQSNPQTQVEINTMKENETSKISNCFDMLLEKRAQLNLFDGVSPLMSSVVTQFVF